MPRLFTGLRIAPEVSHDLTLMRGGLVGARWIEESDYHLTLRFAGDIDDDVAHDYFDELSRIARPRFDVTLDQLSAFGSARPRSMYPYVGGRLALLSIFRASV